jgi:hypothetical protein
MKSTHRNKRKSQDTGDDLWTWAATRRECATVREDPPAAPPDPGWYRGLLQKLSSQRPGA